MTSESRYTDTPVTGHPAEKLIEIAKMKLLYKFPFFGNIVCRMPIIEDNSVPTTAVDSKGRLYFNRKWVNSFTMEDAVFEIAHEVGHLIQRCMDRLPKGGNKSLWNLAADWCDDLMLVDAGLTRSTISTANISEDDLQKTRELDGLVPAVYKYMLEQRKENTECKACKNMLDKMKEQNEKQTAKDKAEVSGDKQSEVDKGSGGEEPSEGGEKHTCGAGQRQCCAGTTTDPGEASAEEVQGTMQVIMESYHKAKDAGQGSIPGHIEQKILELVKPKVDWKSLIKIKSRELFGKGRYTWTRRGRRDVGLPLPAIQPEAEGAVVAIDVSGSVSEAEYVQSLSETVGILKASGCQKITVMLHDVNVQYVGSVSAAELNSIGRSYGGTSHIPLFDLLKGNSNGDQWVQEALDFKKNKPKLLISFTDACSSFPAELPDFEVIWALFPGSTENMLPAYGNKVHVELD